MCHECFLEEITSFNSEEEFQNFDLELTKKIFNKNLTLISNEGVYGKYGFWIYECSKCKTKWWLSTPDYAWRGFFLKEKNAKKHLDNIYYSDKKKKLFFFSIIIILICLSIYYLIK